MIDLNLYKKFHSFEIPNDSLNEPVLYYLNGNLYILDINKFMNNNRLRQNTKSDIDLKIVQSECAIYPFIEQKDITIFNNYKNTIQMNYFTQVYNNKPLFVTLQIIDEKLYIVFYLNERKINQCVHTLNNIFLLHKQHSIINEINEISNNVVVNVDGHNLDLNNLVNIKLYNYQLNDIKWLDNIKKNIDTGNNYLEYACSLYEQLNEYTSDGYNTVKNNDNPIFTTKSPYYGASLINEMGLGKTLIMLCFLLKEPNDYSRFITYKDHCNYFYKRGKNKGQHCLKNKKTTLYCTEHSKTPFVDILSVDYTNLNDFQPIIIDDIYQTNCNLIIAPSHLCDQWVREYYDKFNVKRRVILIINNDIYKNLSIADILFADIIIVSYNFITKLRKYDIMGNTLESKGVNLFRFCFNSIVFDEIHEIDNNLLGKLKDLYSIYKWNITGTPFPNYIKSYIDNMTLITGKTFGINDLKSYLNNLFSDNLVKSSNVLFRLNTRESIQDELEQNIINHFTHKLNFTKIERNIYDSYLKTNKKNYNILIKLCCDPEILAETSHLIKECNNLNDVQNVLLNHHKDKLNKIQINITHVTRQIKDLTKEYLTDYEKTTLTNHKRNLTLYKKDYDNIKRIYDYLETTIKNLEEEDLCLICMDTLEDKFSLTLCGHKFCTDCINTYMDNFKKYDCPKCKAPISNKNVYIYNKIDKPPEKDIIEKDINELIDRLKSTKLGNVVDYIKKNKHTKRIIFSQYDHILNKLLHVFNEEQIKTVIIKGSVYQRNNSIKSFTTDPNTNIILLSSEHSASGLNLTVATEIIFIEEIFGNDQYRKSIESQSIGRSNRINQTKPINVVKFIIKDTVEEELHDGLIIDEIHEEIHEE